MPNSLSAKDAVVENVVAATEAILEPITEQTHEVEELRRQVQALTAMAVLKEKQLEAVQAENEVLKSQLAGAHG